MAKDRERSEISDEDALLILKRALADCELGGARRELVEEAEQELEYPADESDEG